VLETAGARAQRLLAPLRCAGMDRQRQAKLVRGLSESLHFIFEPCHSSWIVAGAHVAAGVHGLDPVAAERMFHSDHIFAGESATLDSPIWHRHGNMPCKSP